MSRGHVPTAEEASLLASIDVRIADEGGGALVGVPIGIEEHDEEHAVGAVRDIDADCLARCLAGMINKQPVALIATESFAQNYSSYLERVMDAGTFLQACQRADNGAQWVSLLGFPKIS